MKTNLVKEPLVRFFMISLFLYLLYGFFGKQDEELLTEDSTIFISKNEISVLENSFQLRYNRVPTIDEKEEFINKYVRELVLYEEAMKMGLDKDDVVIRRRLVLNLRQVVEGIINPAQPSQQILQSYFEENLDNYKSEDLFTFTQLFFNPDKRDETTLEDAEIVIEKLKKNNTPPSNATRYSDAFMLKNSYENLSEAKIVRNFGHGFTDSIITLKPRVWHGPILSGYGVHLVYISDKEIGNTPKLEDIREVVLVDWEEDEKEELNKLFIDNIISSYEIIIEDETTSNKLTE